MSRARELLVGTILVVLTASGCSAQPRPTVGSIPSSSASATASASSEPPPASFPAASVDPSMTAEALFEDATAVAELGLETRSTETRGGAAIRDVRYAGADGSAVSAWLIGPAEGAPKAGIVFLHWLGEEDSSRDEFVEEAVALAGGGVESMLVQQRFPWVERPSGIDHDRVAIGLQVRSIRRAVTLLDADLGGAPLAVAGHDFGAMYGVLAASVDDRITSIACMAPTSTWADWFVTYFRVVSAAGAEAYAASMADLDPVRRLGAVDIPVLLQFGTSDFYVPGAVVEAMTETAPDGTEVKTYPVGHRLDEAARSDRDAWLLARLGIDS